MKWFQKISKSDAADSNQVIFAVQKKFSLFRELLDRNNRALKVISDLEEKSHGAYHFDMNYIASSVQELRSWMWDIADKMINLGGDEYLPLRERYTAIDNEIEKLLPTRNQFRADDYVLHFDQINESRAWSVGSKNANLGELRNVLGLPAPDGFAITVWAYKNFLDYNDLQWKITYLISLIDPDDPYDLLRTCDEITQLIYASPVPPELEKAILKICGDSQKKYCNSRLAVRSSALGEDTQFSFAGRYATYLNVDKSDLIDKYKAVLASKFTPKAVYYYFKYGMQESALAMSVGCLQMVDSVVSGVMYTRDPVNPEADTVLINSAYGLGNEIVDGKVNPDVFWISRRERKLVKSAVAPKFYQTIMKTEGGISEVAVPKEAQNRPSMSESQLEQLALYGLKIEKHFSCPQDIEWAVDSKGKIYLLQARPLTVIKRERHSSENVIPEVKPLCSGGYTIFPGAGAGMVFVAKTQEDLAETPDKAILVSEAPFPGLITVLDRIEALVTETGGAASHMATIAREFKVPAITGVKNALKLKPGALVTVDASSGNIYDNIRLEILELRNGECSKEQNTEIFLLLEKMLAKISPLNLINPTASDFTVENCMTYHDLTRFCHQKAMEEMFSGAKDLDGSQKIFGRLRTDIPLKINIVYLDKNPDFFGHRKLIDEEELDSAPMKCFWKGIKKEGWPRNLPVNFSSAMSAMTVETSGRRKSGFSQDSYAILSEEYMLASLRMGYHFTSVEAMVTDEPNKNYIKMQYKEGGAAFDRRERRIQLIMRLLTNMGFEHQSKGDFLDSSCSYSDRDETCRKIYNLGRIVMMTKQLDMALSSDSVADWYCGEFASKLGMLDQ